MLCILNEFLIKKSTRITVNIDSLNRLPEGIILAMTLLRPFMCRPGLFLSFRPNKNYQEVILSWNYLKLTRKRKQFSNIRQCLIEIREKGRGCNAYFIVFLPEMSEVNFHVIYGCLTHPCRFCGNQNWLL